MKASIIIPTYNRRGMLARTLPTVLAQDVPGDQWEVVIVVDGSGDGTLDFLRNFSPPCPLRVLEQPNRGPASARNAGLKAARGTLALFLDDDILCGPDLLRKHIAAHSGETPLAAFGPVLIAPESVPGLPTDYIRQWYERYVDGLRTHGAPSSPFEVWLSANCSAPRALLLSHNGYDERFRIHEDAEFAIRLWQAGLRFHFEPEAITYQLYDKSADAMVAGECVRFGATEVLLSRTHPSYRRHSRFARLDMGSFSGFLLTWLICRSPFSPDPILRAPSRVAERLRSITPIRRFGISLFSQRRSVATLRSAVREVGSWPAFRKEFGLRLPALLYHHIGPFRPGTFADVTIEPKRFERHISWLADRGYVGVRPSDWLAWCMQGRRLPDKPVLITFDDAYADLCEYALPILLRYGFCAGVFVVTSQIGGVNAWDVAIGSSTHRLMSAEQIRRWASAGMEFGAHGRNHIDLTRLSRTRQEEEVVGSKEELSDLLKETVTCFAYPYGRCDDGVRELVRQAFDCAFLDQPGLNALGTDLHGLHRAPMTAQHSLFDLACVLGFGRSWLDRGRRAMRRFAAASAPAKSRGVDSVGVPPS